MTKRPKYLPSPKEQAQESLIESKECSNSKTRYQKSVET